MRINKYMFRVVSTIKKMLNKIGGAYSIDAMIGILLMVKLRLEKLLNEHYCVGYFYGK